MNRRNFLRGALATAALTSYGTRATKLEPVKEVPRVESELSGLIEEMRDQIFSTMGVHASTLIVGSATYDHIMESIERDGDPHGLSSRVIEYPT